MRCVNLLAGLELDRADSQGVPGALVKQSHQFFVDGIDGFAVFLEAHERLFVILVVCLVRIIVGFIGLFVEREFLLGIVSRHCGEFHLDAS